MVLRVKKSNTCGRVRIPGSKSHTIRAVYMASLAHGCSVIKNPLISEDSLSAAAVCRTFGAEVENSGTSFAIKGFSSKPCLPEDIINVGNSGTSLRFALMLAGLIDGYTVFTGDYQIRSRPLEPLMRAMNTLGAEVFSTRGNNMAPVVVKGVLRGGRTELDAVTSQYLSSILITAPLLENDTEIYVTRLNEIPYADMTMWWLNKLGIDYCNENYKKFYIKGGQKYKAFNSNIPGDFSSATFFMVLAAISGGEIIIENLDMSDPQGDKRVLDYLSEMGAAIRCKDGTISVKGGTLKGIEIDMNSTPDALPAMAVAGCFAEGETRLVNVEQARLKETDRIHVMCSELKKLGADIEELPDGLVIRNSRLKGCRVCGHNDHRVVMALAVAGLNIAGETMIETAESINVTFPEFIELIKNCGAEAELLKE